MPARRCAWIDASAGAAGDMLLAALLDAGASVDAVRAACEAVARSGLGEVRLETERVRRHGIQSTRVEFVTLRDDAPRSVSEVLDLVDRAALPAAVERFAHAVFEALAAAEATVHGEEPGEEPGQAHLHEVAAADSVCDVVGCGAALESLGLLDGDVSITVSAVAVGSGIAHSAHGRIPVPAPAVLALFAGTGATISSRYSGFEACTPTGAAILTTLSTAWGNLPPMQVAAVGVGAGSADPNDRANVVRVVVGTAAGDEAAAGWREDDLVQIEAAVDDLDPRLWPSVLDDLVAAGAHDAWVTPIVMRKGRPGYSVAALVAPAALDSVARALFASSTTLGVRSWPASRRALPRDEITVDVAGCAIRVKRGVLAGEVVTAQPEYAEAAAAAARLGKPVRWVLDRAVAAAWNAQTEPPARRSGE